jgi:hypothetical protein
MAEFRARIEIDIEAENELDAARQAWELLTAPDALLPVIDVYALDQTQPTNHVTQIDLQQDREAQGNSDCPASTLPRDAS